MSTAGAATARLVHTTFGNDIGGFRAVAMTVTEQLDWMRCPELEPRLHVHSVSGDVARDYYRPLLGRLGARVAAKARIPSRWLDRGMFAAALRNVRPGDLVYVWPPYDTAFVRAARARGAVAVAERINCMGGLVKRVLEPAFRRHGRGLPEGWCLPEAIEEERQQTDACDYVTSPGPFVTESLVEAGIARDRILENSQGWNASRLGAAVGLERPAREAVFAFVGSGGIRKGLDLLLEAWERAEVKGTLLIAGRIEDDVRAACARQLALPTVRALGFVKDVSSVYAAADVFVFPTHEEGGPQVIYEATACGLACLVDPFDADGWVQALRALAGDEGLRRRMGAASAASAADFTWRRVGERLREHFLRVAGGGAVRSAAVGA
jgi:glycosyltransferase involved in cell wall biosynthesis